MKVLIDQERCRGHARCLAIAPEAFEFLDLEDRTVVQEDAVERLSPAVLREAERECPERAITVETEEGDPR